MLSCVQEEVRELAMVLLVIINMGLAALAVVYLTPIIFHTDLRTMGIG